MAGVDEGQRGQDAPGGDELVAMDVAPTSAGAVRAADGERGFADAADGFNDLRHLQGETVVPRAPGRWQRRDRAGHTPAARYVRSVERARVALWLIAGYLLVGVGAAYWHVAHVDQIEHHAAKNSARTAVIRTRSGDIRDRHGAPMATDVRSDRLVADPRWWRNRIQPCDAAREACADVPLVPMPKVRAFDNLRAGAARFVAALACDAHPRLYGWALPDSSDCKRRRAALYEDLLPRAAVADAYREVAVDLVHEATGAPKSELRERLSRDRGYVVLLPDISLSQRQTLQRWVNEGRLPGLAIEPHFRRHHPGGAIAGAVVGHPHWQGNAEKTFASLVAGQEVRLTVTGMRDGTVLYPQGTPDTARYAGRSVELTLDKTLQAVTEKLLAQGVVEASADFAVAVVIDIASAEVLAMAQSPTVDPDQVDTTPASAGRNRAIQDLFEPGSTLKVLTYAAALEAGKVRPEERFATSGGLYVPGKLIKDAHPHGEMSAAEAIKYSSNVAIGKIALRLGRTALDQSLRAFGIGARTEVGLVDEIGGQLRPGETWLPVNLANIAFGQGVAVTALQLTNAFATIGRGGLHKRPRLVRAIVGPDGTREPFAQEPGRRVVSEATAAKVIDAMALVCEPGGTARRARLDDYKVVGKTGTAQQVGPGGYSPTHWVASFVALIPREKPRLAIFVAVDTPRKVGPGGEIIRTGGAIAAPVVREIARFALPYLAVPKSPGAPYLSADDPEAARLRAERQAAQRRSDESRAAAALPAAGADPNAAEPPVAAAQVTPPATGPGGAALGLAGEAKGSKPAVIGSATQAPPTAGAAAAPPPRSGASPVPLVAGAPRPIAPQPLVKAAPPPPPKVEAPPPEAQIAVDVPDLHGLTIVAARAALLQVGLRLHVVGSGVAASQRPAARSQIAAGAAVEVSFARRSSQVSVAVPPPAAPPAKPGQAAPTVAGGAP